VLLAHKRGERNEGQGRNEDIILVEGQMASTRPTTKKQNVSQKGEELRGSAKL
jgi:hypothetical protein